jgi:MFS transporter, FHS family, L-fucose permease
MSQSESGRTRVMLYTVYFIYFFCGMTMCFEGAFNPEIKEYFGLTYQQQMYTLFAKNIPFVLALAIGFLIQYIGYKSCLSVAMALFGGGTLLLVPGLNSGQYGLVLAAFFIIGLGFNFELVAGNPLLSGLGSSEGGSSRLNLGNALGAIAQIIAPLVLTLIIPATVVSAKDKLPYMKGLFVVIGLVLFAVAGLVFFLRSVDVSTSFRKAAMSSTLSGDKAGNIWLQPRLLLGFVTIFLVLGAEASLFGLYRNYLEDPQIAGLSSRQSYVMFTVYFATFAAGRLVASWAQKRVRPVTTLVFNLVVTLLLLVPVIFAKGAVAVTAVTAMGFFVSLFFPTLYSLAIEGMGEQTAKVSGLLTMGFLGCALLPVLQGRTADSIGLQSSFAVFVVPYLFALFYALKGYRLRSSNPERDEKSVSLFEGVKE